MADVRGSHRQDVDECSIRLLHARVIVENIRVREEIASDGGRSADRGAEADPAGERVRVGHCEASARFFLGKNTSK